MKGLDLQACELPFMLTLKAPAKINWFLNVLRRRDDGFHDIRSVVQKVTLFDLLTFSNSDELTLATDFDISAEDNLVYKAAYLLRKRYDIAEGALISLEKNIPAGAGLGGGSSDAAATLIGLNKLWKLGLSLDELSETAQELGSDVPLFLYDSLSYVYGRGEMVETYKTSSPLYVLIVKPDFDVSTAWAYKNITFSELKEEDGLTEGLKLTKKGVKDNNIRYFVRKIGDADISDITGEIYNDLEKVTVGRYPVIDEIKKRLISHGATVALMSGSGSAVFGVFGSPAKADEASKYFSEFWTAAVQTLTD